MRILVTGGSGFIGTNVVDAFIRSSADVCSVDIEHPRLEHHRDVFRHVNILDSRSLDEVFSDFRPSVVIHLAARADMEQRRGLDHFAANIAGVSNVLQAIRAAGTVERSIFASTRLVFDLGYTPRHETDYQTATLYGQSKAMGEDIIRSAPDAIGAWTIVRPTGIWGPWFGEPYKSFFTMVEKGFYVHPGRSVVRKSYGYVENIVFQLERLLTADLSLVDKKTFWLADYEPVVVSQWADEISSVFGGRPIKSVPVPVLRAAAAVGDTLDRFGRTFPMTSFRLNNMTNDMVYDMSATEAVVGPLPFTLQEGTAKTVEWLRHNR